jgi:DUF4097 and DUF4098 domain-containing protein YvlB
MERVILSAFFMFCIALPAFCGGNLELVNTKEINLDGIIDVKILYSSERVSVSIGTTDTLIIKEYMSKNDSRYFAKITNSGNTVTIENGRWPIRPFNTFNRSLEVYLPPSYRNTMSIKTSSGKIEASDLFCSILAIESSSGNISVDTIVADTINIKASSGRIDIGTVTGDVSIRTSSGNIDIGVVTGDISTETSSGRININQANGKVSAETSSGNMEFSLVNGSVNAKTSSGNIRCTIGEGTRDISLNTASGNVRLNLPRDLNFSFSSRTSSGSLSSPFSDRLSIPLNDKNLTQGVISNNNGSEDSATVNIRTSSGSIRIEWT